MKVSQQNPGSNSVNECSVPSDLTAFDTDSMSTGSTSAVQDVGGVVAKESLEGLLCRRGFGRRPSVLAKFGQSKKVC